MGNIKKNNNQVIFVVFKIYFLCKSTSDAGFEVLHK